MEPQTLNDTFVMVNVILIYVIVALCWYVAEQKKRIKRNDERIDRMRARYTSMLNALKKSNERLQEIDTHLTMHCPEYHIYYSENEGIR